MRQIFHFIVVAIIATVFASCEKEFINEVNDDKNTSALQTDVYSEDGCLVFRDFRAFDSIMTYLNEASIDEMLEFESRLGFQSAYMYRYNSVESLENLSEIEMQLKLNALEKEGYYNSVSQEFSFPFLNESFSAVLNKEGKVRIGNVMNHYHGDYQTVSLYKPESTKNNVESITTNIRKIPSSDLKSLMISEVILFDNITSDSQQRLTMRVIKEYAECYKAVDGKIVFDGYTWYVKLRYHGWRQRLIGRTDENTYFHRRINHLDIEGNDGIYHDVVEYTSPYKAIFYEDLFAVIPTLTPPVITINDINIDCWSDRVPWPINEIRYPN